MNPESRPEPNVLEPLGFYDYATAMPDKIALVIDEDNTEVSYSELGAQVNQLSRALLELGLVRGQTVAAVLGNSREMLALQLATDQIGLYLTPINWHLTPDEAAYILADCGAEFVVTNLSFATDIQRARSIAGMPAGSILVFGAFPDSLNLEELSTRQPVSPPPNRSSGMLQLYSSGTTGRPKGIRRPLPDGTPDAASRAVSRGRAERFGIEPGSGAHLVVAPLYHSAPNMNAIGGLHLGHTVVLAGRFDPVRTLELIEHHRVTTSFMVPLMFHRLLSVDDAERDRFDISSLQAVMHSGAPCPIHVKKAIIDWFGPAVYEYYGSSETGIATVIDSHQWVARPGSVGRPAAGIEIKIFGADGTEQPAGQPGEIFVKGGTAFRYRGKEAETAAQWRGEFYSAGDVGYLDPDGYLFMQDRRTDLIISGGVNIYPAEVEAALISEPTVADVAVIGAPDPEWGQKVMAVVQLVAGEPGNDTTITRLLEHSRSHLAKFKIPRDFVFWDELPRTPTGKISRSSIRAAVLGELTTSSPT
jgi:long-chain acyl-CoA synthetase